MTNNQSLDEARMESILLETLSFFEFMNMERVVFDLDVIDSAGLTIDDVKKALDSLVVKKMVVLNVVNKEKLWKRQIPPRNLIRKILSLFS